MAKKNSIAKMICRQCGRAYWRNMLQGNKEKKRG